MSKIPTFTGKLVDPFNLQPDDICIEDIAHSLSLQCRFNGHCRIFYSVAEHSVRIAKQLGQGNHRHRFWGLMHDSAEAYISDIIRPLKTIEMRKAERLILEIIAHKFKLDWFIPNVVWEYDEKMLATEAKNLMIWPHECWKDLPEPYENYVITPWSQKGAEDIFLAMFKELYTG